MKIKSGDKLIYKGRSKPDDWYSVHLIPENEYTVSGVLSYHRCVRIKNEEFHWPIEDFYTKSDLYNKKLNKIIDDV